MCKIKFRYEILYRRIGDELTIHTAEIISRNSIEAEKEFKASPFFKDCEFLDYNMIGACSICG